jgi:hypothetical protein
MSFEGVAAAELQACGYPLSDYRPGFWRGLWMAFQRARPRQDPTRHYRPPTRRLRKLLRRVWPGTADEEGSAT